MSRLRMKLDRFSSDFSKIMSKTIEIKKQTVNWKIENKL